MKDTQRHTLTRQLLKDGLLRLLHKKALEKITVSELCKESGINRSTFYRHYGMPLDVLKEIHNDFFTNFLNDPCFINESDNLDTRFDKLNVYLLQNFDTLRLFLPYLPEDEIVKTFKMLHTKIFVNTEYDKTLNSIDERSRRLVYAFYVGGSYFMIRALLEYDCALSADEISDIQRLMPEYTFP